MAVEPAVGSDFAGHRIEAILGRGGMGVLYRASEIASGRVVALKLIAPEFARDEHFRRRFEREARLAARIDHPHVVPVLEAGRAEDRLFLTTRLVDGTDLEALIATHGALHPRHAATIAAQVAAALDAAHAEGLVHRDVKPGNILIESDDGRPHAYLTDFGLSKLTSSTSGLTKTGRWVGTLDYAAPEQIQANEADPRTDVYALGCVLFEMLTGQVPFPRTREVSKIAAHLSEPPPPVSDLAPGLPANERAAELDDVVRRALAKRPADRPGSAGELGRAALAAVAHLPAPREGLPIDLPSPAQAPVDRGAPTAG